jgi:hypothetical protein
MKVVGQAVAVESATENERQLYLKTQAERNDDDHQPNQARNPEQKCFEPTSDNLFEKWMLWVNLLRDHNSSLKTNVDLDSSPIEKANTSGATLVLSNATPERIDELPGREELGGVKPLTLGMGFMTGNNRVRV